MTTPSDANVILTEKGIAAVADMDHRYEERCRLLGIDSIEWHPHVWIEANEEVVQP